jgi:integrase
MSVRKRKWQTAKGEAREAWIVDYVDQHGERHIETFGLKKDADAREAQVSVDVEKGIHTAASKSMTVAQAAEDWISFSEGEGLERSTVDQYRSHLTHHILPRLGNEKLARLTSPRINNFRDELIKRMSRAMAKKVLGSLKAILKDAKRRGNAAQTVAELRGLRWSDVDLSKRQIHVRQRADRYRKIGHPKSAAGTRTIPIGDMVVNTLREWKLQCPKGIENLTFPTGAGTIENHANIVNRIFDPAQVAAGVVLHGKPKYGMHALRHFYASWCINRRADGGLELPPKTVQARLGHASIVMTLDRYGHLFPTHDDGTELASAERALFAT